MTLAPAPPGTSTASRRDLSDRTLVWALAAAGLTLVAYYAAWPWLPPAWHAPGSPVLQSLAIVGSLLLLMPLAFTIVKRGGGSAAPTPWFAAHVTASIAGFVLVAIHAAGRLGRPPALLLLGLLLVGLSGALARLWLSRRMAATLGTKRAPFRPIDREMQARLRALIARKRQVLANLDPAAGEATFSVTLPHLVRAPRLSLAYLRLAHEESRIVGTRGSVGSLQAWWRPLHILIGAMFLGGLLIHVVTATFFAGWVADGRPIYWWHLTAW